MGIWVPSFQAEWMKDGFWHGMYGTYGKTQ